MSLPNYTSDPVAFMQRELHFQQWSKQREIAEALRDHERVAVTACNASGKSALAGACVPWWLAGGPGSIVLTTSATERQLKRVLWREVHRHYRQAAGLFDGAVLTELEVFLREDWYAVGLGVDTVEAFQGHHGSRVLVIVERGLRCP
ncbi:MAG: hypothetical protein ACXVZ3_04085 [Gaiellaceae bacterium]